MSRHSGPAPSGGWRTRERKRAEAAERNARTPIERTAKFRRDRARVQAAIQEDRAS